MKRLVVFWFGLVLGVNLVNSQNFEALKEVQFSDQESFNEYREQVTDCCSYVLQTPNDKKDEERKFAIEFVTRWLKDCPHCKFTISDNVKHMTEERADLIGLFAISYAAVYMDNEQGIRNANEENLNEQAISRFLNYCEEDMNKIKLTKEMKKVIQLKADGSYSSLENIYATN